MLIFSYRVDCWKARRRDGGAKRTEHDDGGGGGFSGRS